MKTGTNDSQSNNYIIIARDDSFAGMCATLKLEETTQSARIVEKHARSNIYGNGSSLSFHSNKERRRRRYDDSLEWSDRKLV